METGKDTTPEYESQYNLFLEQLHPKNPEAPEYSEEQKQAIRDGSPLWLNQSFSVEAGGWFGLYVGCRPYIGVEIHEGVARVWYYPIREDSWPALVEAFDSKSVKRNLTDAVNFASRALSSDKLALGLDEC